MSDDSTEILNDLEQACYRGIANLALSKNQQWLLSKELIRAKAISLAEKLKSLDLRKADHFFKTLEDFPKFPDDKEIQSHLRSNMDRFGIVFNSLLLDSPRNFLDPTKLDELSAKYPAFNGLIDLIRKDPESKMPEEFQKDFAKLMADPKNFQVKGQANAQK